MTDTSIARAPLSIDHHRLLFEDFVELKPGVEVTLLISRILFCLYFLNHLVFFCSKQFTNMNIEFPEKTIYVRYRNISIKNAVILSIRPGPFSHQQFEMLLQEFRKTFPGHDLARTLTLH